MNYRIGDRVRINHKERGKPKSYDGMVGTVKHIKTPNYKTDKYFIWGVGVGLDEPDPNGQTRVIFGTMKPLGEHKRLTKIDTSKLHPKTLNYRKFNFSQVWK